MEGTSVKHEFHYYYRIGLVSFTSLFVVEFLLSHANIVEVPDAIFQLTAVVLGATFAAFLTTVTYDYISRSTQEREWKREIQMTNWKDIYLPIYKHLVSSQSALESYHHLLSEIARDPDLPWKETILEIINPEYPKKVGRHIELFYRYREGLTNLADAVTALSRVHHENLFPKKGVENLDSILIRQSLYFGGIATIIPYDEMTSYVSLFNNIKAKYPNLDIDATSSIEILKSKVQGQPEVKELSSAHSELTKSTKGLIEATKEVIQRPYQL